MTRWIALFVGQAEAIVIVADVVVFARATYPALVYGDVFADIQRVPIKTVIADARTGFTVGVGPTGVFARVVGPGHFSDEIRREWLTCCHDQAHSHR